ncbi:hypothetical protein HF908_00905 [Ralstonia pseudosolanacearum]|uniref:hypothetical protein n=1 Tax=Ralstonia pseudosolanacearum TaxID=1310165 RepID=UPI001868C985|nr:hypothetical protein [Ralstonia pseudosolanacearum]QOK90196.1 hypothetical protein HF908_00905 [Ralstonia pseudosolanacearum]
MVDIDSFSADQKRFLSLIVSDLDGPTATGGLLRILEATIGALKPDWMLDPHPVVDEDLRADLDVCLAALRYMKVKDATAP